MPLTMIKSRYQTQPKPKTQNNKPEKRTNKIAGTTKSTTI